MIHRMVKLRTFRRANARDRGVISSEASIAVVQGAKEKLDLLKSPLAPKERHSILSVFTY